jgi:hypothetical protein
MRLATLALALLATAGCSRPVVPTATPDRFSIIRSYACESDVAEPQPAWNPATYQLLLRNSKGFILHQEGRDRREVFRSERGMDTGLPAWTGPSQFVFGPLSNLNRLPDGSLFVATQGISVVDVVDGATKTAVNARLLAPQGCRPRPSGDVIFAQSGRRMIYLDRFGTITDAGEGFWPEPEPRTGSTGMAWQDTPVMEPDIWTGRPARGFLNIRWSKGDVDRVPGATQARWTADGRVVATVLRGEPATGKPWWTAGTDVVVISPGGQVRIIAPGARDGEPHPSQPVVAVTAPDGGVTLVGLDGSEPFRLTFTGNRPRWSHDGLRLAVEETGNAGATTIRVHVLKIDLPSPAK